MRAVSLLLVSSSHNVTLEQIAAIITEKLHPIFKSASKHHDCNHDFHSATSSEQAKHMQQLKTLADSSKTLFLKLKTTIENLAKTANNLQSTSLMLNQSSAKLSPTSLEGPAPNQLHQYHDKLDAILATLGDIQPTYLQLTASLDNLALVTESSKVLAKVAENLQALPTLPHANSVLPVPSSQTYASAATSNLQNISSPHPHSFNPNIAEYITCIENRLCIQE